ncbi:DUF4339 domain-containing protein [Polaribacter sp. Z014]|uniref:DUF4339 domain-containing protein n=1 Tax=Polaribacter sp. Z014 TaxID=2927126 RepID=UPI00201FF0D4|nr:DUF4339 domain-containing protein [Polaribacter sp. Z014]MCL7763170.1 DUF4339 domain-containing protein [Polaribacter sp. Z014]
MKEYYYADNDQKIGPLSKTELKGKVSKDTLVWKGGMGNWIKASQLPELNDLFLKEPPPIPGSNPKNEKTKDTEDKAKDAIEAINLNAILLSIITIVMGIMEYKELESSKFYGFLITALVIATYYLLSNIKKYLNDVLNFIKANRDINILIVTSIILGVGIKLATKFEDKLDSSDSLSNFIVALIVVVVISLFVNWYYFFKLGKKLSKLENSMASRISKFAYATVISYALVFILDIFTDNSSTIIASILIGIIPLLYLITVFNKSEA